VKFWERKPLFPVIQAEKLARTGYYKITSEGVKMRFPCHFTHLIPNSNIRWIKGVLFINEPFACPHGEGGIIHFPSGPVLFWKHYTRPYGISKR
jgi:hypothetical protein